MTFATFLLVTMLGASPGFADKPSRPAARDSLNRFASDDWIGKVRGCPNVRFPDPNQLREIPSQVRMIITLESSDTLAFEFLDHIPYLLGTQAFTASLEDDYSFSVAIPYRLRINGEEQEGAQILIRGRFRHRKGRERLRLTAESSFPQTSTSPGIPICLTFDLALDDSLGTKENERSDSQASSPQGRNRDSEAEAVIDSIVENLRAKPILCPRESGLLESLFIRLCAELHPSFGEEETHVLRVVDGVLDFHAPVEGVDQTWLHDGSSYARTHPVGAVDLTIQFDVRRHEIAASYRPRDPSCPQLESVPGLADLEEVTPPSIIPDSHVGPRYPRGPRIGKDPGTVVLETVIRRDGSIGEICVLSADPSGLGFEEAAIEAVKQWRYVPAKRDGEPIAVRFVVRVDFAMD